MHHVTKGGKCCHDPLHHVESSLQLTACAQVAIVEVGLRCQSVSCGCQTAGPRSQVTSRTGHAGSTARRRGGKRSRVLVLAQTFTGAPTALQGDLMSWPAVPHTCVPRWRRCPRLSAWSSVRRASHQAAPCVVAACQHRNVQILRETGFWRVMQSHCRHDVHLVI